MLLHYRLVEKIGEGGMGVVWRATDTGLGRDAAIKLLPPAVADDPDRLARLEREARVLAALNHPNVAGVHGLHDAAGVRFVAMEYVPGEDLAQRIARGPIPADEAIALAIQIARGLAAAHDQGIVHRDLKPANVKVTPDGAVKVLDFGLARAWGIEPGSTSGPASPTMSPTITSAGTVPGVILGTAAYMSPEQARGRPVDRRTDLWAFGCVLYETLTGRRAFAGETVSDTLAAVLRAEPDLDALPADLAPAVSRLVRRCLAKDAAARWRDAGDAALELSDADASAPADAPGTRRPGWRAFAAGILLGAAAVAVGLALGRGGAPTPERVLRVVLPDDASFRVGRARISPDGRTVATIGQVPGERATRLRLHDLASGEIRDVPGRLAGAPFVVFSPDSTRIAFVTDNLPGSVGPNLVRMNVADGTPPVAVAPWTEGEAVWLDDRELAVIVAEPSRLLRFPIDGRDRPEPLALRSDGRLEPHDVLPDGAILAQIDRWDGGWHRDAVVVDPATGEVATLVDRAFEPTFVPPGTLLFSRGDRLFAVGFDPAARRVRGEERVVATGLRADVDSTAANFAVSDRGDLVHIDGGLIGADRRLVRVMPDGTARAWGVPPGPFSGEGVDDSQDGSVIAVVRVAPNGLYEIWASELDEPVLRPALSAPAMDCSVPSVSPDGSWILGTCFGDEARDGMYLAPFPPDGTAPRRALARPKGEEWFTWWSWLPDGRHVLVVGPEGRGVEIVDPFASLEPADASDAIRTVASAQVGRGVYLRGEARPTYTAGAVAGLDNDVVRSASVSPDGTLFAYVVAVGDALELRVAPWDGRRIGPFRPIGPVRGNGHDWIGVESDPPVLLRTTPDGRTVTARLDRTGRVVSEETVTTVEPLRSRVLTASNLSDGSFIVLEMGESEVAPPTVRVVTDWVSTWTET